MGVQFDPRTVAPFRRALAAPTGKKELNAHDSMPSRRPFFPSADLSKHKNNKKNNLQTRFEYP